MDEWPVQKRFKRTGPHSVCHPLGKESQTGEVKMSKSNSAFILAFAAGLSMGLFTSASTATAFADSGVSKVSTVKLTSKRSLSKAQVMVKKRAFVAQAASPGGYPNDNMADAWTAFCYSEFGPNAPYPDSGMLQWCLGI
ncbi:MAG: hypothetical protein AAFR39_11900 [Pseudomonadota bacterium]